MPRGWILLVLLAGCTADNPDYCPSCDFIVAASGDGGGVTLVDAAMTDFADLAPLTDAATGDAAGADGEAARDLLSVDLSSPDLAPSPPDMSRLANGQGCTLPSDCASGLCEGHVCCDKVCPTNGGCQSCATGTCAPTALVTCGAPSCIMGDAASMMCQFGQCKRFIRNCGHGCAAGACL